MFITEDPFHDVRRLSKRGKVTMSKKISKYMSERVEFREVVFIITK